MQLSEREERIYSDGIALGRRQAEGDADKLRLEIGRLRESLREAAEWPGLPSVLRKRLEKALA